jgi:hypothetical protein
MWSQIVGKTRLALTPLENHWWNVTLYVTPRGLTTSAIPYQQRSFEVEFDFLGHKLRINTSEGTAHSFALYPRSVADFYGEYMHALRSLGIEVTIHTTPEEFDDKTPFDQDQHHVSYDSKHVESFRRILINADFAMKDFRSRFTGKGSPVHFFWGSFDLNLSRFSGRRAPIREGMAAMMREAYSHEEISCGFWPGDRRFKDAAFYAYTVPAPEGLENQVVRPGSAYWNSELGEFILKYDEVRSTQSPKQTILDFCQSTYEAGATLAKWDRDSLERKT